MSHHFTAYKPSKKDRQGCLTMRSFTCFPHIMSNRFPHVPKLFYLGVDPPQQKKTNISHNFPWMIMFILPLGGFRSHRGTPKSSSIYRLDFPLITNHPAIGVPPLPMETIHRKGFSVINIYKHSFWIFWGIPIAIDIY